MSEVKYKGECLCGAIRFTISNEHSGVAECHCEHCRKGAGGIGQVMGTFSKDDLKFEPGSEESISTYVFAHTSSGKPKDKTFCKGCGVPLWTVTESARSKGQIFLRTALLDKGSELKPQVAIFTKGRPAWAGSMEGVAEFDTMP
ncbi:Mss4-like protein [Naviculisporaceae sp. PSN 640]